MNRLIIGVSAGAGNSVKYTAIDHVHGLGLIIMNAEFTGFASSAQFP